MSGFGPGQQKPKGAEINKPAPGSWPAPPFTWSSADYAERVISIVVDYNETTGAITGATTHRDDGCLFDRILFGVGEDGQPDSTNRKVNCPVGDRNVPKGQLNAVDLNSITDILSGQVTAGRPPGQG